MSELNYEHVFNVLVDKTAEYVTENDLKAMVLGISGGIDSTVVAAICHEVSKKTSIPLIGRSLPIKNKNDEFDVSKLVGEAFCDDFRVVPLQDSFETVLYDIITSEDDNKQTPIANGNIQARLRMIYLYNLASIHKGLVMSTDNQTEYQLGFWTIHGDVGDFDPIQDLWKTEVYGLAKWYQRHYANKCIEKTANLRKQGILVKAGLMENDPIWRALEQSIALTPTDGLGISNSDLEQIGAKSYYDVDRVLQTLVCKASPENDKVQDALIKELGAEVTNKIIKRHRASEFKRKKAPIYISRELYE